MVIFAILAWSSLGMVFMNYTEVMFYFLKRKKNVFWHQQCQLIMQIQIYLKMFCDFIYLVK